MPDMETMRYSLPDEKSLSLAYMPFVKNGGLFLQTNQMLPLGSKIMLEVQLMGEPEPYQLETIVIWQTPTEAQGSKPSGLGVQFTGEQGDSLRNKITDYLADMLDSIETTYTM